MITWLAITSSLQIMYNLLIYREYIIVCFIRVSFSTSLKLFIL